VQPIRQFFLLIQSNIPQHKDKKKILLTFYTKNVEI